MWLTSGGLRTPAPPVVTVSSDRHAGERSRLVRRSNPRLGPWHDDVEEQATERHADRKRALQVVHLLGISVVRQREMKDRRPPAPAIGRVDRIPRRRVVQAIRRRPAPPPTRRSPRSAPRSGRALRDIGGAAAPRARDEARRREPPPPRSPAHRASTCPAPQRRPAAAGDAASSATASRSPSMSTLGMACAASIPTPRAIRSRYVQAQPLAAANATRRSTAVCHNTVAPPIEWPERAHPLRIESRPRREHRVRRRGIGQHAAHQRRSLDQAVAHRREVVIGVRARVASVPGPLGRRSSKPIASGASTVTPRAAPAPARRPASGPRTVRRPPTCRSATAPWCWWCTTTAPPQGCSGYEQQRRHEALAAARS